MTVPDNFEYTKVTSLKRRPPASVVDEAVVLLREAHENTKTVDLEVKDNVGVSIGHLGTFSRSGLGQLEWLGEVANMQYNSREEKEWLMQSPDNLDDKTRNHIYQLLYKSPLKHIVAKEGKHAVTVRTFSKLALERYLDDTVIDTAIERMCRQFNLKESVLCLPAHTITWLNTGDGDFIRDCFEGVLLNVKPALLRLILVPVNMNAAHWGLIAVDVQNKEAYFDDGLGWTFTRISYVHRIIRELHSKFPECDHFSLKDWNMVQTFKRFGMPRQPAGSGSCGVGVVLSAKDLMRADRPRNVSFSWNFDEMTVHRKDIMKLLSST